ncbi:MAG TPA: DNA glycosylase, partial [Tissierellaceae bacterium]
DLSTDYDEIKATLSKDEILKEATEFGSGIRILNQDPFETIISFIISANNQIPRIRKSIEIIAKEYGDFIENYNGIDYYSFPTAEKLSKVDVLDLREKARVGFRDKRIIDTSIMIANNEIDIEGIFSLSKDEGKEKLMELPGVGPKVSDCILLFAYDKSDAFPVDVWVKRVMEYFYLKEETSLKNISKQGDLLFKDLAGYAQQYLFYYARELDIGK